MAESRYLIYIVPFKQLDTSLQQRVDLGKLWQPHIGTYPDHGRKVEFGTSKDPATCIR